MATKKGNTTKGLKLAGTALAVMYIGGEWRPVVRSHHRFEGQPEVSHLAELSHLKPSQRRKVQQWIGFLEPANSAKAQPRVAS